ncbi:MAG TPA: methyl-accepting chemotaxis protein [Usitatibacter sp.]|nr:methyl-accepting chemotaxis protein [Usitatibacter sp.]
MRFIAGSIRNKVLAVLALGIALVVAGALYGFAAARNGLAAVARVNDTLTSQSIDAQAMEGTFKEQLSEWMAALARGHNEAALDKSLKQFTYREREVRRTGEKLKEAVELPAARALLDKFLAAHKSMGDKYREAMEASRAAGFDARKVDAQVKGLDAEPAEVVEDLVKVMRDEAKSAVAAARAQANRGLAVSLAVIGLAALFALVTCGLLIMRTVVRPLAHAVTVVDRVAEGDLTVEVRASARDETGRLLAGLAKMRDGLAEAVSMIRRSADGVGIASKQIASGHADLSSRTEEQASSLEQTAASMEQLAATVKQNADSARQATVLAAGATQTADKGGQEMARAMGTMGGISQASRKIADILGVIDSIAFQTNILALNAAVEAARAGEQGRGFAVVASEVRALAQRSAAAAKEIKALIQDSVQQVDEGTRVVEAAGVTMQEIVASIQRVSEMMTGISEASQEQLRGIEQVSGAVTTMDRVVQQNAALVSESAEAAQSMADQATELVDSVARFKLASDAEAEPEPEDQPEPPQLVVEVPARREPALQAPGQVLSHLRLNARK